MKSFLLLVDAIGVLPLPRLWDPAAWVGFSAHIPLWAAGALVGLGLVVWMFGAGRGLFRFVLAIPFAALGLALGPWFAAVSGLSEGLATHGLAAALALVCVLLPWVVLFVSFGAIGGYIIGHLVAGHGGYGFSWGAIPGFFVIGGIAMALRDFATRLVSGLVGSVMLGLGLLKLIGYTPLASLAVASPTVDVLLVAVLAVLSVVYQTRTAPKRGGGKGRRRSGAGRMDFDPPQRKVGS